MRDAKGALHQLNALKSLGVRIAIDDFGTGYSSLAYLQQFPVDSLKIDRSFISGMGKSPEGDTLIHTLIQLGKALNLETLAEGIEEDRAADPAPGREVRRRAGLPLRPPGRTTQRSEMHFMSDGSPANSSERLRTRAAPKFFAPATTSSGRHGCRADCARRGRDRDSRRTPRIRGRRDPGRRG